MDGSIKHMPRGTVTVIPFAAVGLEGTLLLLCWEGLAKWVRYSTHSTAFQVCLAFSRSRSHQHGQAPVFVKLGASTEQVSGRS